MHRSQEIWCFRYHTVQDCPYPQPPNQTAGSSQGMKVLFVKGYSPQHYPVTEELTYDSVDSYSPAMEEAFITTDEAEDNKWDLGEYDNTYDYAHDTGAQGETLWLYDTSPNDTVLYQNKLNDNYSNSSSFQCLSIPVRKIQTILFLINNIPAELSLDSGCEGDCVKESECLRLGIPILPLDKTDSTPTLADGKSALQIVGKAKFSCTRDKIVLNFDGYVVKNLQANILCGAAFLSRNKIIQELHKNKMVINGKFHILESSPFVQTSIPPW